MPYCNWCQLESDVGDSCVWCKRPFNTGPGIFGGQKRTDLHLLKDDDEPDVPIPVFALVGVVVFIGILSYALFAWRSSSKPTPEARQVVSNMSLGDSQYSGGYQPARRPTMPQPPSSTSFQPSGQSQQAAPPPSQVSSSSGTGRTVLSGQIVTEIGGFSDAQPTTSIYFESAKLQLSKEKDRLQLSGSIVLVNDTQGTIDHGLFWVKIGGKKVQLFRVGGGVNSAGSGPFAVAAKDSIECSVRSEDLPTDLNQNADTTIGMDGKIAGAPVHCEMKIQKTKPAVSIDTPSKP